MNRQRAILFFVILCILIIIIALLFWKTRSEVLNAGGQSTNLVKSSASTSPAFRRKNVPDTRNLYESPIETDEYKKLFDAKDPVYVENYEVRSGDSLAVIAKRHGFSIDLLKKINGLGTNKLHPGQKLAIPKGRFSVVVDKSRNILMLKANEEVLKIYTVSTGRNNSTPVGVFKITDKIVNPTWYTDGKVIPYGHPKNVLGTRWMGFDIKGYGIHGTTEPEKLGRQVTDGCVRMKNSEAEELFGFLSKDNEVTIVD